MEKYFRVLKNGLITEDGTFLNKYSIESLWLSDTRQREMIMVKTFVGENDSQEIPVTYLNTHDLPTRQAIFDRLLAEIEEKW